jgi:hypothetical protein
MRDLVDPVICWCRKHRELACQKGGFVACFSLNISMVQSSTLVITADGKHLTCGGFTLGEIIRFGSLEFIADNFRSLSLSPKGNDSGADFRGMAHGGSLSLHTILEDSADELL